VLTSSALETSAQCCIQVDTAFKGILARVAADLLLRSFAEVPAIDTTLAGLLSVLEACQNALHQFLELKRSQFPRFARLPGLAQSTSVRHCSRHDMPLRYRNAPAAGCCGVLTMW
jgi:Dynein heavy chain, N-terminal region 2